MEKKSKAILVPLQPTLSNFNVLFIEEMCLYELSKVQL